MLATRSWTGADDTVLRGHGRGARPGLRDRRPGRGGSGPPRGAAPTGGRAGPLPHGGEASGAATLTTRTSGAWPHYVGLAGRVVSGTPQDSLHLVDLICSQAGGARPQVIVRDTGSYSDIVFGLVTLLGFDYRPQLADLPDAKLWRIDPKAHYGGLNGAAWAGSI